MGGAALQGNHTGDELPKSFMPMIGLGVANVCTLIVWSLHHFGFPNFCFLVYLAGGLIAAWRWGRLAAGVAMITGMIAHDLYFKDHAFTFPMAYWPRFVSFLGLLAISQLVAVLVQKLRSQIGLLQTRERETAALYAFNRVLAMENNPKDLLHAAETFLNFEGLEGGPSPNSLRLPLVGSQGPLGELSVDPAVWNEASPYFKESVLQQVSLSLEKALTNQEMERARAEAAMERTCSSLLSAISHDFRTPLTTIGGAAFSLLSEEELLTNEDKKELCETILTESQRLDHLVGNLLEITRLEHGALRLRKERQPIEDVLGAVINRLEAQHGPLPIRMEISPESPLIPMDSALIGQLFLNLLENALKYAPGAALCLHAEVRKDEMIVQLTDSGPGIPESQRERIFDKFTRTSHKRDGGVGLGLAICKAIVEAHGGRIWTEAAPGGGAAFCFTLPLTPEQETP